VNRKGSDSLKKFASGFHDLPGYAMVRSKEAIGFILLTVELMPKTNAYLLYFSSSNITRATIEATSNNNNISIGVGDEQVEEIHSHAGYLISPIIHSDSASTDIDVVDAYTIAVYNRDMLRLKRFLAFPSLISNFMSFPECIVFIVVITFFI
jgi:hypothetical protein